jgi:ADP-dependent NAD(P)H-hydrate dehydratase / NAD(P)H-hydrate epimerase
MKIVTAAEMREIDRATTEQFGIPSLTLMENAGSAVAEFARIGYEKAKSIGVICGKGNNGGDGFVAARKLHEAGHEVHVLLLAQPAELRGDARQNYEKLPIKPVVVDSAPDLESEQAAKALGSDLLIDAILGTGFRPPVTALYRQAIRKINAQHSPVIAVDIPSGADADRVGDQVGELARADAIVTFTAPRPAHVLGNLISGPTVVAPIGSPDTVIRSRLRLNLITPREIATLIGPRPRDSNKGKYGHVLVVGGSVGKSGAAAMAGISALRVGAGLATIATARSVLGIVAGYFPELMTEPLDETSAGTISASALKEFEQLSDKKTLLAIGPGISRHPDTAAFVRSVVSHSKIPLVLDADGLNAYEGKSDQLKGNGRMLVLTPHPGEMARLTAMSIAQVQSDRVGVGRSFAEEHGLVLVLKGDRTIVARPDGEVWVNTTGNPGMATGGTGDILTGMVAGLMAQNLGREFDAVLAAVYLHGLAGDMAKEILGEHSLIATDLVESVAEAFEWTRQEAQKDWVKIGNFRH